jgi:hypothetical protein
MGTLNGFDFAKNSNRRLEYLSDHNERARNTSSFSIVSKASKVSTASTVSTDVSEKLDEKEFQEEQPVQPTLEIQQQPQKVSTNQPELTIKSTTRTNQPPTQKIQKQTIHQQPRERDEHV